jgi:hypothetical protein
VSGIETKMSVMGYSRAATHTGQACRSCGHGEARSSGLRCLEGGFYVVPSASCQHFTVRRAAPAEERRVHVGPTDI